MAPLPFAMPLGAEDTFHVTGIKRGDTLSVRSGPGRDQPELGDMENGLAGIVVTGPRQTTDLAWYPIRALVHRDDGTTSLTDGFAAASYIAKSNVGLTGRHELIRRLGFSVVSEVPANPDGLDAVIATRAEQTLTFFFAKGVYVGSDLTTPHTEVPTIASVTGNRVTVKYGRRSINYLLDQLPIRVE